MCLMYTLKHDLAPPPLKQCVSFCRDNVRVSRASEVTVTLNLGKLNLDIQRFHLQQLKSGT